MMRFTTARRKNKNEHGGAAWISRAAALVFWISVWQAASYFIGYDLLLPSPFAVAKRMAELALTSVFWRSVFYTASKICAGFFTAIIVGSALACLSGMFRCVRILLFPFMAAVKSVPVASFVILALIWLDSSSLSVFIAFVMVLPILYVNVLAGLDACDGKLVEMARVFRMPPLTKGLFVYLPYAFPYFRSGCAVALGLCWKAGVAAELIGVPRGSLGEQLYFSKAYFLTTDLLALTVVIILLSVGFEKLFLALLDRTYALYERM